MEILKEKLESLKIKLKYRWEDLNIIEKYRINLKGNCIHFLKIIPFYIIVCTYFHFLIGIPNLISNFTYDESGFLLLFIIEIIVLLLTIILILVKVKINLNAFLVQLFLFKIMYIIPLIFVWCISFSIFKNEITQKDYVGLSKYEEEYSEDSNGESQETLNTFPSKLYEVSDTQLENLQNMKKADGDDLYISKKFYFWQTSIIHGYDISNVRNVNDIEYSNKVLLNLSLFFFLIYESFLDGIPMFIILMSCTILCYLFNYRFPFRSYNSLRTYINKSSEPSD